jgi:hypothetical protein
MAFKRNQANLSQNGFKYPPHHSPMNGSYDRMTDDSCYCWWCRLRPKDLPAGAHFGIAGTALFCSFHRYEEGLGESWENTIPLMAIGLSYSEKLNYSDMRFRHRTPHHAPIAIAFKIYISH